MEVNVCIHIAVWPLGVHNDLEEAYSMCDLFKSGGVQQWPGQQEVYNVHRKKYRTVPPRVSVHILKHD